MKNFNYPYFSRDIAEFWRRWHISLSTWFRDYLYIPLGGSRVNKFNIVRNVLIIFIVSGFWHGANWTFIIWGALNALYFLPSILNNKNRKHLDIVAENKKYPSFKEFLLMIKNFILVVFAWIFFRADNLETAFIYIKKIFVISLDIERLRIDRYAVEILPLILLLLLIEWFSRTKEFPLINDSKYHHKTILIIISILIFGNFSDMNDFIYFQF